MTEQPKKPASITTIPFVEFIRAWGVPTSVSIGLMSTLVGIADFLSPKMKLLPPLTFVAFCGLVGVFLLRKWMEDADTTKGIGKWLSPKDPIYHAPAFNAAVVASILLVGGTTASAAKAEKNGFLASHFDSVASLQQQLGLVAVIDQTTKRIEAKVDLANNQLAGVDQKIDRVKDVVTGNAPMVDPRMELSRMGIPWNASGFGDAIRRVDTRVIQLFLEGGMPAHLPDSSTSTPPMANLIPMPESDRNKLLTMLAQANVPLGTGWRTRIAGHNTETCLPITCFGWDIPTCARSFPRRALWEKLVELSVKPDRVCLDAMGVMLYQIEHDETRTDDRQARIKILRFWGVQDSESYKDWARIQEREQKREGYPYDSGSKS